MKIYTVHLPPEGAARTVAGSDGIRFVKDGFIWAALFIPILWMIFQRMWLPALGYLALCLALIAGLETWGIADAAITVVAFLINLLVALEGGALLHWSLRRKGWHMIGVVTGADRAECEAKGFRRWLAGDVPDGAPMAIDDRDRPPAFAEPGEPDIIGLFPEPGR